MVSHQDGRHTTSIVVIGIGNAYRGDDAVGPVVARCLQGKLQERERVTVLTVSGDGTDLLASWKKAEVVVLIDAVQSGARPGTVHRIEAGERPLPRTFSRCSTHTFGVAEAVELARTLHQLPPHLIVYGIEGKAFKVGTGLSAAVMQAVPEVVAHVQRDLQAF
jgi:hydrogenase maturation protease